MNRVNSDSMQENAAAMMIKMEQMLTAQRHAFLRDGAPTIAQRKAALRHLRSAILAQRGALTAAVSADFGHRSPYETDILEILVTEIGRAHV